MDEQGVPRHLLLGKRIRHLKLLNVSLVCLDEEQMIDDMSPGHAISLESLDIDERVSTADLGIKTQHDPSTLSVSFHRFPVPTKLSIRYYSIARDGRIQPLSSTVMHLNQILGHTPCLLSLSITIIRCPHGMFEIITYHTNTRLMRNTHPP